MAEETPFELVQRRRGEGVSVEALEIELAARGLDRADIALLLGQPVFAAAVQAAEPSTEVGADSPWALVQKLKAEGFPPDSIARELASRGHSKDDIHALLLDEGTRGAPPPSGGAGAVSVQLIFGTLLVLAGVLLMLGGRISLFSILLVISGVVRAASAFGADRRTSAQQAEARSKMATLAADDPRARCALHPDHASIGSCPRCGSFCCARCTPVSGFAGGSVCMQCQANPEVRAERLQRASRVAAYTLLVAPGTIVLIGAIDRLLSDDSPAPLPVLAFLTIASAPWLLLAAVQANVRARWPTLVSVVPWVLMAILLAGGPAIEAGLWLVPLGAAFYGWANARAAARLEVALAPSDQPASPLKESETSSSA